MPNEPIVLIPGLLCTHKLFSRQIAALNEDRAIFVGDHASHDNISDIAASILAAAPPRFVLGGLSMGGYVAFEIVAQAPQRVSRLVLFDTTARADTPEQGENRARLITLARERGLRPVIDELLPRFLPPERLADQALVDTVRAMAEETGVDAFVRQQQAIKTRPDRLEMLADINCPTLVMVGHDDQVTPVDRAQEMASGIAGARLEVVPAAGHLVTLEQPKTVNALLLDWLAN